MSPQLYQSIICAIDIANSVIADSTNSLANISTILANTQITSQNSNAFTTAIIGSTSLLSQQQNALNISVQSVLQAMHINILRTYPDVNTFLSDNDLVVPQWIAAIAGQMGDDINDSNIGNCSTF